MKIAKLKISNWRSIKDIEIPVQNLMIVIGQNNHGKSNLLSAILFFFGEIKHHQLDFNDGSQELFVEITFSDLDQSDRTTFKKYVTSDGKIIVRKTGLRDGNFQYQGYISSPTEEFLKDSNANAYTRRDVAESLPIKVFLPDGKLSKQIIIDAQQQYIAENIDQLTFNFELETTNFLGLKSVAKGIFGDVYFVPAIKEASEDFSSAEKSAFGKMYAEVVKDMTEKNHDWKSASDHLTNLFGSLNDLDSKGNKNNNRPQQLVHFEKQLSDELSSWGANVEIEVTAPDTDSVFKANTSIWVNDGARTDIKRKGHGLQRALSLALVKVLARRSDDVQASSNDGARTSSRSSYFLFEEPELYLHPQAQRSLFDSLVKLSESNNQVILCTHSSGLIDLEHYKSICIVTKKDESSGTKIKYCNEDLFVGDQKKDFNLSYWINPDRSELFFAAKVLLVEGATDKTVIPHIAKKLGVFRHDFTIIDCGAKTSIPQYIRLLNCFAIPYVAIYDKDHQSGKKPDALASADNASKAINDQIDSALGKVVVFDNDIEEEIGMDGGTTNKPYLALTYVSKDSFKVPTQFEAKISDIYR